MRSILMIVLALCVMGCNNNDGEDVNTTTLERKESSILLPPDPKLKAQGYNDRYVKVDNTPQPDYQQYRKQWKHINQDRLREISKLTGKSIPVLLDLCDLPFKDAFELQHHVKGEGQTFWWRGGEYTTDHLKTKNPSVD